MSILLIFFGMVASGKSTLGQAWAERYQTPYYNTDRVRKELLGLHAAERRPDPVGQGIYSAQWTEKTYAALLERARADVLRGRTMVVLDGSYSRKQDRKQVRRLASELGARCLFVWCVCSEAETKKRLTMRACDPKAVSDGRWEIYLHQKLVFEQPEREQEPDCLRCDTEREVRELLEELARAVQP